MVYKGLLNNPGYICDRLQQEDEAWAVAESDGIIKGVAALVMAKPVGLGEIERVCVSDEYRGNGLAGEVCEHLLEEAGTQRLGFVEAFARGDIPAMQRTFEKIGFKFYGVAPRFEVMHGDKVVREQFVHMGYELQPETIDENSMRLIPQAQNIYNALRM